MALWARKAPSRKAPQSTRRIAANIVKLAVNIDPAAKNPA
jgi:hypothetical protein